MLEDNERKMLLEKISEIRKNYFNNFDRFTQPKEPLVPQPIYGLTAEGDIHVHIGEFIVTKQNQNIFGNVGGNVNQVAAKTIRESFNQVTESEASSELKSKLEELGKLVEDMLGAGLSEKDQKKVARDYKGFAEEATSEEPRKEWYELSAKGLIEAAKTVGEIATPVIAVVKSILALLG
jgi:hypothetical protein